MAQSYGFGLSTTNTSSATNPMFDIFCIAATMPALYELDCGSRATADNAVAYTLQRTTVRGTSAATATVLSLGPVASTANANVDTGWSGSVFPTITAGALLQIGMHQRATYRWIAYDYTKMIYCAASNGICLTVPSVVSPFTADFSAAFQE